MFTATEKMDLHLSDRFRSFADKNDKHIVATSNYIDRFFVYGEWLDVRLRGSNNNTIQAFFNGKAKNLDADFTDKKKLSNPTYLQEQFQKFHLQISDIDVDLDISSEIRRKCSVKKTPESFSLIEFGCAPGGIATFIFDINWRIDSYAKDGGPEAA